MRNRFAYAVAALAWGSTLSADAQRCYTLRDGQGKIVRQSVQSPVDTLVPYNDEIASLLPG